MKSDTDFANPYEKELDAQESKIKELEAKNVELEKYVQKCHERLSGRDSDLNRLEKKLEIAVEALEFYGNRMSYSLDDYNGISGEMRSRVVLYGDSVEINDVSSHAGRRANEALKKIKWK